MIKISSFAKAKNNGSGNNSASSGGAIVPTVIMKKTPNVKIWGQWHDHTGDVDGDMTVNGKIDVTGDITSQSSIIGKKGDFEDIVSKTIKSDDIQAKNVVSDNGFINNINASSINTDSIDANYGYFDNELVENLTCENGTIHNLTVTGKAHFFELVIDKISASGGAVIFSPADGFEVEKVIWHIKSSTNILNIPNEFLLPTNYKMIEYNNWNWKRAEIDVNGNKSNALVVRPYNTTLDLDWYYFWETGELMTADSIVELKYPELYGQYKVVETTNPKDGEYTYNYKYDIVTEDTNEYLYNLSYPNDIVLIDYKKLKVSVCGHDIDGNIVEIKDTIKYATKVWKDEQEYLWFYEEDKLINDLNSLYPKYDGLYQSYTRTYIPTITTKGIAKFYFESTPWLLFLAENEQGKAIRNEWQVNDQAICKNFNEAHVGAEQNVKNKYYWGLVKAIDYIDTNLGRQFFQLYIDADGNLIGDYLADEQFHVYHAICLDPKDYDGVLDCEPGDAIAMLGNRKLKDRQKAIYISAYTSIDTSLQAPLFAQYEGINSYSLDGKKTTWFAANGNKIQGKLVVESGKTVEDLIKDSEDKTSQDIQDLIDKYDNWINNVEDNLADTYLKALPTTTKVAKTYLEWQQAIGTTITFETVTTLNESTHKYEVLGSTKQIFPSLKKNDKVAVEVNINQTYQDSTVPNNGTVLGTVTRIPLGMIQQGTNRVVFRTNVKIEYVIDADLSQVWLGMSQLKVDQDGIKMSVTNLGDELRKGISSLEILSNQIQSRVDNLEGDVSSITQQADNIQLQVNDLAIKLDGKNNKIVLDGDTEVNGVVNINKDGTGLKLSGSNGQTFSIGSNNIGTFENFDSSTAIPYWYTHNDKTVSFYNDFEESKVRKTVEVSVFGNETIHLKAGKQIQILNVAFKENANINSGYPDCQIIDAVYVDLYRANDLQYGQLANAGCNVVEGEQKIWSYQNKYNPSVRWPVAMNGDKVAILSYTAESDIDIKIKLRYKVRGLTPDSSNTNTGSIQLLSNTATINAMTSYQISVDAFGKLTYNGFGFNFGGGKTAFIGGDQMIFKISPFCGWRLTSYGGLQRLVPNKYYVQFDGLEPFDKQKDNSTFSLVTPKNAGKWIGITDSIVREISYSNSSTSINTWVEHLCLLDEVVVVKALPSGKNIVIILPQANKCAGKKYYIKNNVRADSGRGSVYVGAYAGGFQTKNDCLRDPDNNKRINNTVSLQYNAGGASNFYGLYSIDRRSIMFISDGTDWNIYYCG